MKALEVSALARRGAKRLLDRLARDGHIYDLRHHTGFVYGFKVPANRVVLIERELQSHEVTYRKEGVVDGRVPRAHQDQLGSW